jgi:hypothetical protein
MLGIVGMVSSVALGLVSTDAVGSFFNAPIPTTRCIEGSEQSFWMGFTDDIVVRVAEAGSGSRIIITGVALPVDGGALVRVG